MNKVGILATLQARPGKEAEVEQFLRFAGPSSTQLQDSLEFLRQTIGDICPLGNEF